jgi:hypothetical protein
LLLGGEFGAVAADDVDVYYDGRVTDEPGCNQALVRGTIGKVSREGGPADALAVSDNRYACVFTEELNQKVAVDDDFVYFPERCLDETLGARIVRVPKNPAP